MDIGFKEADRLLSKITANWHGLPNPIQAWLTAKYN